MMLKQTTCLLLAVLTCCLPRRSAAEVAVSSTAKIFAQILPLVSDSGSVPHELQIKPGDSIVAIGDSITAGGTYLHFVEQVLAAHYPELDHFQIMNAGKNGQKAEDLLARFESAVLVRKPTFVMINIGINDVWHRLQEPHSVEVFKAYRANVTKLVELSQAAGIRVILLAPTIIQEDLNSPGNLRLPVYAHAMREIAARHQCQFIDLHAMFLSAVRNKAADKPLRWLTADGVHMQPLGSAIMALGVLRALGVPDAVTITTDIVLAPPKTVVK